MNRKWKQVTVAAVMSFSLIAIAGEGVFNAGSPGREGHGKDGNGRGNMEKIFSFEKLDTNGDGMISREEFEACRNKIGEGLAKLDRVRRALGPVGGHIGEGKMKAAVLAKYDLNHNGEMDPEELDAVRKDREELVRKHDKDNDGKLNQDERKALREELKKLYGLPEQGTCKAE
ncbi:MAG: hypothetical protein PHQ23_03545 [Candidatus Wallbacteria bacterium]|nr:hypothetical protein [Candidatus Wallbacteria bacterium]